MDAVRDMSKAMKNFVVSLGFRQLAFYEFKQEEINYVFILARSEEGKWLFCSLSDAKENPYPFYCRYVSQEEAAKSHAEMKSMQNTCNGREWTFRKEVIA